MRLRAGRIIVSLASDRFVVNMVMAEAMATLECSWQWITCDADGVRSNRAQVGHGGERRGIGRNDPRGFQWMIVEETRIFRVGQRPRMTFAEIDLNQINAHISLPSECCEHSHNHSSMRLVSVQEAGIRSHRASLSNNKTRFLQREECTECPRHVNETYCVVSASETIGKSFGWHARASTKKRERKVSSEQTQSVVSYLADCFRHRVCE